MSEQNRNDYVLTVRFRSFMKLGSSEEQALKLLILDDDQTNAIAYTEGMRPKDIQHLFNKSIQKLDNEGKNVFMGALRKNPKLLSVLIAKLILKKDYISYEDTSDFMRSLDIELTQNQAIELLESNQLIKNLGAGLDN